MRNVQIVWALNFQDVSSKRCIVSWPYNSAQKNFFTALLPIFMLHHYTEFHKTLLISTFTLSTLNTKLKMHTAAIMLSTNGLCANDAHFPHIPHHTAYQSHTLAGARDDLVIKACKTGTLRGSVTCKQFVTYTPPKGQFL
jgi:hypothetical protein